MFNGITRVFVLVSLITGVFFSSVTYGLGTPPTVYGINPPNTTDNATITNSDTVSVTGTGTNEKAFGISSVANNATINNTLIGTINATATQTGTISGSFNSNGAYGIF